mgnify:CR=1 FL=1
MRLSLLSPLDSLIAPPPEAKRVEFLARQPFAHRGLHGGKIVENSRAAFAAAIAAGQGIELDVQAGQEGEAFVFHDATLADIARRRPKNADALKTVSGVGQSKLTRYGAAVLDLVRKH